MIAMRHWRLRFENVICLLFRIKALLVTIVEMMQMMSPIFKEKV